MPETLWNVTIKNNVNKHIIGNENNITLPHANYFINAILYVSNKPLLSYSINLSHISESFTSNSLSSEIQSLLYLGIIAFILIIIAAIMKKIKKYL